METENLNIKKLPNRQFLLSGDYPQPFEMRIYYTVSVTPCGTTYEFFREGESRFLGDAPINGILDQVGLVPALIDIINDK